MLCNTKPVINYVDSTFGAEEERSYKSVWASNSSLQSAKCLLHHWHAVFMGCTVPLHSSTVWVNYWHEMLSLLRLSAKWKRV